MFEVKAANFEKRVRDSFSLQKTMKSLNVSILEVEAGRVVFEMPFNINFTQQHGFTHGGIIASVLDSACGFAAFSLMSEDTEVLTIDFKTSFLAPAKGDRFRFEGKVLKPGRTVSFTEAQAFAINEGKQKLIATMTASMMAVQNRTDVQPTK